MRVLVSSVLTTLDSVILTFGYEKAEKDSMIFLDVLFCTRINSKKKAYFLFFLISPNEA